MPDLQQITSWAPDGTPIRRVSFENGGARAYVLTYGATLQALQIEGIAHSVILGSSDPTAYIERMRYFGGIVGPLANRVAAGRLVVDGRARQLDRNENGRTTLHGGAEGFGTRNWEIVETAADRVTLSLQHPDGLCGFPGTIEVMVTYGLDTRGVLTIEFEGRTGRPTVFGPAFHGYWSLDGKPDLTEHRLCIDADRFLAVDEDMIPTGEPTPVAGTAFDYREPRTPDRALDHNFCLSDRRGQMRHACTLEAGDLRLDIETTEPGLQVYTGRKIATAPFAGHSGYPYCANAGIALEPQLWPDAPNHPSYPSPILRPGETYRQVSRFTVTRTH